MQLNVLVERVDTNVHFLVLGLVIFSLQMDTEGVAFFIVRPGVGFKFSSFRIFTLKPLCYARNLRLRELNSSLLPGKTIKGKWGLQDLSLCECMRMWRFLPMFELGSLNLSLLPILSKRLVCFQLCYKFCLASEFRSLCLFIKYFTCPLSLSSAAEAIRTAQLQTGCGGTHL